MSTATRTAQSYTLDASHSTAAFVVRHMMIAKVRGHFNIVTGSIELAAPGNVPTSIEAVIEVASIDTREPQRDTHLKSPDFFDAEKFPQMTFRSTKIEGAEDSFSVTGDLTIHGTTKPVTFKTTFEGAGTDPWGNERVGYEAVATINRKDFGLAYNQALETGGVLIGEEVKIELSVEAVAKK